MNELIAHLLAPDESLHRPAACHSNGLRLQVMEDLVISAIRRFEATLDRAEGLVFVGGLAFNVLLNAALLRTFRRPLHVPCTPGDGAVSIGGAWTVRPPPQRRSLQFLGLRAPDAGELKLKAIESGVCMCVCVFVRVSGCACLSIMRL